MENIFVEFLPPWVETGLQPAFYDKESGTVLQQTARMYDRVNMLIRMFNKLSKETKETVENYIQEFDNLYTYVHDYFDNLDVQEEINNKLDQMLEDGVLQEIVESYLNPLVLWGYDTVASMKSSTNLIDGCFAKTLGYHSKDDGGMATYKIRKIEDSDTVDERGLIAINDELVAELIIEDHITPEMVGAYGDNVHDDTTAVQYALDYGCRHIVLGKRYKISTALSVANWSIVDGGGNIYSSTTCFELDGPCHIIMRDLRLYPQLHAIHITSDNNYANYNVFENIHAEGANTADSKGIFIEVTNRYINEFTYRNCVMWNFKYGIYATNDTANEMSKHYFDSCSTELSKTAGQYIKNGNVFTFICCRHVESISLAWVTEGTCNQLTIIGGPTWFINPTDANFSNNTNGQIIASLRYPGISVSASNRDAYIVQGKVIPNPDAIQNEMLTVNVDKTISYGDQLYSVFKFGSATADAKTLTLPETVYGSGSKISKITVATSYTGGASVIVIGNSTITLPAVSNDFKCYSIDCVRYNNADKWHATELTALV